MQIFKIILAAAAVATISAAPAEARLNKHPHHHRAWSAAPGPMTYPGECAHYGRDPYGVYVGYQEGRARSRSECAAAHDVGLQLPVRPVSQAIVLRRLKNGPRGSTAARALLFRR